MSAKKSSDNLRTWIEIDARAVRHNCETFKKLVGSDTKLWAVVKSNAYGHGLVAFSRLADRCGVDGFCVDSLVEGSRLRNEHIKRPILVLGFTLPALFAEARAKQITLTVSNWDALKAVSREKHPPDFHIKIDTGMHRQGFYLEDMPRVVKFLRTPRRSIADSCRGFYTHFASAKDVNYPTHTERQFREFERVGRLFEKSGFKTMIKHCAATGGTLLDRKYHGDAVRVGIGLYGLYPSHELELASAPWARRFALQPVLSWRTIISEVKTLRAGDFVGYDLTERIIQPTKMAVLPIGYWHGFSRSLSGVGHALIRGRLVRVLGRVSMDLVAVDVGGIRCGQGDTATLIGRSEGMFLRASDVALAAGTSHYEFLTRINPLIERKVIGSV